MSPIATVIASLVGAFWLAGGVMLMSYSMLPGNGDSPQGVLGGLLLGSFGGFVAIALLRDRS